MATQIEVAYALAADPVIRRCPSVTAYVQYCAARGGQDGVVWASASSAAEHIGVAEKNVPRLRRRAEALGYLIPLGRARRSKKYRVEVPDRDGLPAKVAAAMTPSSSRREQDDAPIKELETWTLGPMGARERWSRYCAAMGGEDRARRRHKSIVGNADRPDQAWREHVADVLRASRRLGTPS